MNTKFKKGDAAWNKGLKGYRSGISRPDWVKKKISETRKQKGLKPAPYKRNVDVIISCSCCKSNFSVVASRKNKAKFCSKECYKQSMKGRVPPNAGLAKSNTYGACHFRVRKLRGKPSLCEVCGTSTAKKFEWANMTGNYSDIYDYKRMCASCHKKHDKVILNLIKKNSATVFFEITGVDINLKS